MKFRHKALTIKKEIFLMSFAFLATVSLVFSGVFLHILYKKNMENAGNSLRECNAQIVIYTEGMFHENESIVKYCPGRIQSSMAAAGIRPLS